MKQPTKEKRLSSFTKSQAKTNSSTNSQIYGLDPYYLNSEINKLSSPYHFEHYSYPYTSPYASIPNYYPSFANYNSSSNYPI